MSLRLHCIPIDNSDHRFSSCVVAGADLGGGGGGGGGGGETAHLHLVFCVYNTIGDDMCHC